jgi:hypothetical protein
LGRLRTTQRSAISSLWGVVEPVRLEESLDEPLPVVQRARLVKLEQKLVSSPFGDIDDLVLLVPERRSEDEPQRPCGMLSGQS